MLKSEKAISLLIKEGYNDELVTQLPKLFIEDFFEAEQAKLSKGIDILIDMVQSGHVTPDANNNVNFAGIIKMEEYDMDPKCFSGLFYNFKSHITEEFMHVIQMRPLRNILLDAGAMEYPDEYRYPTFSKEIVGGPEKYQDLCQVSPRVGSAGSSYIKVNDLYSLLLSKGFSEESISVIWGESSFGPRHQGAVPNEGIYVNYDAIMKIGNPSYGQVKK